MSDKLASILAAIQAPGGQASPAAPTMDPMALMLAMFQQQQATSEARMREEREARQREEERRREEKAESNKMLMALAGLVIPKLLDKPAVDPLMLKMLENNNNKEAMQQFLATSSQLNQQSSQMFMQQLGTMMGTMGDMQSRMTERQMEMMETRMEKIAEKAAGGDDEESNPIMDVIKAAIPAFLGPKAAPVAAAAVTAIGRTVPAPVIGRGMVAAEPAGAPVVHPPEVARKILALQLAMALQLRGDRYDADKVATFKRKILALVARTNDVARAIIADDSAALFAAFAPAVEAEKPLGGWIMSQPAQAFLGELVANDLRPGLLAIAQEIARRAAERDAVAVAPAVQEAPPTILVRTATLMPQHGGPVVEPPTLGPADVGTVAAEAGEDDEG